MKKQKLYEKVSERVEYNVAVFSVENKEKPYLMWFREFKYILDVVHVLVSAEFFSSLMFLSATVTCHTCVV